MDMRTLTAIVAGCVLVCGTPVLAQDTLFEIEAGGSYDWRNGSAINQAGFGDELDRYGLADITGRVAHRFGNGLILQGELRHDESFADTLTTAVIPGLFESDETYRNGQQLTLQLGKHAGDTYFGGFATVGQANFKPVDDDQDTTFSSVGLQLEWYADNWSLAATVGTLDSWAENPESIDNAILAGVSGAYYVTDRTRLGASLSLLSGEQDTDSRSGADPVDVIIAGVEVQHQLVQHANYTMAMYGGLDWIDVKEQSSASRTDRATDTILSVGIRMSFGAQSGVAYERQRTPALPDMLRAIGVVPVVD